MYSCWAASHSQIATIAVPILLHTITLAHHHHPDLPVPDGRAGEEVADPAVLPVARLLPPDRGHGQQQPQVSQRATIYLGTIHDRAVQSLLWCLDCQFDMVPVDRPYILKSLLQLFNTLDERKILTWEFFANRFDFVIQEIQESSKAPVKEEQDNGHCQLHQREQKEEKESIVHNPYVIMSNCPGEEFLVPG